MKSLDFQNNQGEGFLEENGKEKIDINADELELSY